MKTAKEFDEAFDNYEDLDEYVDWSKATRPNVEQRRVNLDLPKWMIEKLDMNGILVFCCKLRLD